MTRRAVAFDRVCTLIAGVALLASGMAMVAWQRGVLGGGRPLQSWAAGHVVDTVWWPWVGGALGFLAVLIGLRWLIAHGRAPRAKRVGLGGAGTHADLALTADVGAVAQAAASVMACQAGIVRAQGVATLDRGMPTVTMTITLPARHGVRHAVSAADETAQTLSVMLGDTVAVRTLVRADPKNQRIALQ